MCLVCCQAVSFQNFVLMWLLGLEQKHCNFCMFKPVVYYGDKAKCLAYCKRLQKKTNSSYLYQQSSFIPVCVSPDLFSAYFSLSDIPLVHCKPSKTKYKHSKIFFLYIHFTSLYQFHYCTSPTLNSEPSIVNFKDVWNSVVQWLTYLACDSMIAGQGSNPTMTTSYFHEQETLSTSLSTGYSQETDSRMNKQAMHFYRNHAKINLYKPTLKIQTVNKKCCIEEQTIYGLAILHL